MLFRVLNISKRAFRIPHFRERTAEPLGVLRDLRRHPVVRKAGLRFCLLRVLKVLDAGRSERKDAVLDPVRVHLLEASLVDVHKPCGVGVPVAVGGEEARLVGGHCGPLGKVLRDRRAG